MSKQEKINDIEKDLQEAVALSAISESDGGKILVKSLLTDIVSAVDKLSSGYMTLTMQEFVAISATLKSNKEMLDVLVKAKGNKEYLEGLLKEALQTE